MFGELILCCAKQEEECHTNQSLLGSTEFKVEDREIRVTEGTERENRLDLPQAILTQLVVGYRSVEEVMNENKVNAK